MKYCGVVTPYKGVWVYVRAAMGMRGFEIAFEEVICRLLEELIHRG